MTIDGDAARRETGHDDALTDTGGKVRRKVITSPLPPRPGITKNLKFICQAPLEDRLQDS